MELFRQKDGFILGMTGTHKGMQDKQKLVARFIVGFLLPYELHHGDCIGADAEFHNIVRELSPSTMIVIHPPDNDTKQAKCQGDFSMPNKPYIVRDDAIIVEAQLMVAFPSGYKERGRGSGTWAVIRHTRKAKKPLIIVWPDGTYTPEGNLQFSELCGKLLENLKKTFKMVNN